MNYSDGILFYFNFFRYLYSCDFEIDILCFYISISSNSTKIFDFINHVKPEYFVEKNFKNILESSIVCKSKFSMLNNIMIKLQDDDAFLINNVDNAIDFEYIIKTCIKYDNHFALHTIQIFFVFSKKHHSYILEKSNKYFKVNIINYYSGICGNNFFDFDIDINDSFIESARSNFFSLKSIIKLGFKIPEKYRKDVFQLSYSQSSLARLFLQKKTITRDFMKWGYEDAVDKDRFCKLLNTIIP